MTRIEELPYRRCVGIMLFNSVGQVWIGRRVAKWQGDGSQKMWQMPQGGIDEGESPAEAALRELHEEIGTREAVIIGEHPDWLNYDLPKKVIGATLGGKYRGQTQKWFAMRFSGDDRQISIDGSNGHEIEFEKWRWGDIDELSELVVPFKRDVYKRVVSHFREFSALK